MDKVNILGVHVDMVNISQATDCIMRFLNFSPKGYTKNDFFVILDI